VHESDSELNRLLKLSAQNREAAECSITLPTRYLAPCTLVQGHESGDDETETTGVSTQADDLIDISTMAFMQKLEHLLLVEANLDKQISQLEDYKASLLKQPAKVMLVHPLLFKDKDC